MFSVGPLDMYGKEKKTQVWDEKVVVRHLAAGEAADVALQRPHVPRAKLVGRQLAQPPQQRLPLLRAQLGHAHAQLRQQLLPCRMQQTEPLSAHAQSHRSTLRASQALAQRTGVKTNHLSGVRANL